MIVRTVAILSPGDMGHALGRTLQEYDIEVITCLNGRSERTRWLASQSKIKEVHTLEELVTRADIILSILVPSEAMDLAQRVADALKSSKSNTFFADCNAVSPRTSRDLDAVITAAGGRFIDAGIIGGPPSVNSVPRFYVSGPYVDAITSLDGMGIQICSAGDTVGSASSVKMCYSAMTKGTHALYVGLLMAAKNLGVFDDLCSELAASQPDVYKRMEAGIPRLPSVSRRFVGEMEEIAATFEQVGITSGFHYGAAEIFSQLGHSSLAEETPETMDMTRTMAATIAMLAKSIKQ